MADAADALAALAAAATPLGDAVRSALAAIERALAFYGYAAALNRGGRYGFLGLRH